MNQVTKSRAAREGVYTGQIDGKPVRSSIRVRVLASMISGYYAPNRKAHKAYHIDYMNSLHQGVYGGHIKWRGHEQYDNPFHPDYDHGTKLLEKDC